MSTATCAIGGTKQLGFFDKINSVWHKQALLTYTAIVLAHWSEHFVQATQIYILHWPPKEALGVLGMFAPWLVKSELLHYSYALVMLVCFWFLRKGFVGRSKTWWMIAFWIQFWHHIEHGLLQGQAIFQHNLFNSPVPTSIAQLFIPRVELHLFYNTIVFIPMALAMFYHMFPKPSEAAQMHCACAWHRKAATAKAKTTRSLAVE